MRVEVYVKGQWCELPEHPNLNARDAYEKGAYYASAFEVEHPELGTVMVVPRHLPVRLSEPQLV